MAGMTNKILAGVADAILTVSRRLSALGGKVRLVGNPVRADIAGVDSPEQRFAGRTGPLKLLVVGGSLGAVALNDNVPKALALLPAEQRPQVIHQAGAKNIDAARQLCQAGVAAECVAFIDNMALAYADADLVICRAGALTVAELAAVGVASVLVPYPHAVDDHQTGNAKYLADNHAAVLLPQSQMNPDKLAGLLREMNRDKLLKMAQAARNWPSRMLRMTWQRCAWNWQKHETQSQTYSFCRHWRCRHERHRRSAAEPGLQCQRFGPGDNATTRRLKAAGATIHVGHAAESRWRTWMWW